MNLTNPPLTRGLGKTGLLDRKGLVLGTPSTQGLAQTATREAREGPLPGRDLKITQMVVAFSSSSITSPSDYVVAQELVIHRRAGSLLDITWSFQPETLDESYGGGPFFRVFTQIRRAGSSLQLYADYIPVVYRGSTSADDLYSGRFTFGFVDDDYVSGQTTYDITVKFVDAGLNEFEASVQERYLRVLERRQ